MNIKIDKTNLFTFKEVKIGECFMHLDDLYIKTEEYEARELILNYGKTRNSVRLSDGEHSFFYYYDVVKKLNGIFVYMENENDK